MKLDTDVLDETFASQPELREYNHAVLCYSCMSL